MVPRPELLALFALFNARRYAEMEAIAGKLAADYPDDGQAWKAWGVSLLAQGKEAVAALLRAAALLPRDAEVVSSLGGVHNELGQYAEAAECYRQALRLEPSLAYVHSNLGDVLTRVGNYSAAETSCREAVRLQPGLAAAHVNLGSALRGQGRLGEAAASYRQALTLNPRQIEAHRNLARVLHAQGDVARAISSLREALTLQPEHAVTQLQLGLMLLEAGQAGAALPCLRRATQLEPDLADSHYQLGNALLALDLPEEAVAAFQRSIAVEPLHAQAQAHSNLGVAFLASQRPDEAVTALRQALALQPDLALAHSNLANGLVMLGQFQEALSSHGQAVQLAPEQAIVHANLGHALKASGRADEATRALKRALALDDDSLALHSQMLFMRNYDASADDAQRLEDARRFGALAAQQATARSEWPNARHPDKLLRVGLLSGDLRQHPVGYFLESVLAALAALQGDRVELFAYANQRLSDELSDRLRACCSAWRKVLALSDAELASCIYADGIDVLIDLSGHTLNNRLPVLAWRPAPVQVSWLGYCATTGLAAVDAFMADPWIVPPGAEAQFTEPILRLPNTFLCFTPPPFDLAVGPLPALTGSGVRFACFNDLAKMNDSVVRLWSRVLHAVPGSVLVLRSAPLQDPAIQRAVLARYAQRGIHAERLVLRPAQPRCEYLAGYGDVDIALDPFPYPGGTTTLEALWMGVPVLTFPGDRALSRQGLSLLQNLGLTDWVAAGEDDYVARAVHHARDLAALSTLRQSLRQRLLASPLCDAPVFARHLEAGMRDLWRRYCRRSV